MIEKHIIIDGNKHKIGDKDCSMGWCSCIGWPHKCECGGLIHAEFGDEDMEGNYYLITVCDKCGEQFYD